MDLENESARFMHGIQPDKILRQNMLMSMYSGIVSLKKVHDLNATEAASIASRNQIGHWCFCGPAQERTGTQTDPKALGCCRSENDVDIPGTPSPSRFPCAELLNQRWATAHSLSKHNYKERIGLWAGGVSS